MSELNTTRFAGFDITTLEHEGRTYAAMKHTAQRLGLDWSFHKTRLQRNFAPSVEIITAHSAEGRAYPMLCLPLEKLPVWLMTLEPHRASPAARASLERYQAESEAVLLQHLGMTTPHMAGAVSTPGETDSNRHEAGNGDILTALGRLVKNISAP